MKRLTTSALVAGLFLLTALVAWSGAGEVGEAVVDTGWGTALVALARVGVVVLAALGWWAIFPRADRPALATCINLRFAREGVNTLLPVAQVGGDVVGARLLSFRRIRPGLAAASVIVDVMLQAFTQFLFTLGGLAALVALDGDAEMIRYVAIGLCLAAPLLVGFYVVQRRGGRRLLRAVLERFAGGREWRALGAVDVLYDQLVALYADKPRLARATLIHLLGWVVGTLEVWVALRFMGHPVGLLEALVIESLAQAVRGAAFVVPGGLGAQEGGLIALCALFGVPAGPALALSLVKRVADLLVGVPGLLTWQALEGRSLARRRRVKQRAAALRARPGLMQRSAVSGTTMGATMGAAYGGRLDPATEAGPAE